MRSIDSVKACPEKKTAQFPHLPCGSLNLMLPTSFTIRILLYFSLLLFIFQQSQDEAFPSEAQFLLEDWRESHQLMECSRKSFQFAPKLPCVEAAPLKKGALTIH